jgi:hypothetical protein
MTGSRRTYEQSKALEVLKATASTFIRDSEEEFYLEKIEVKPFGEVLASRMVELIFAAFPKVQDTFREDFERARTGPPGVAPEEIGDLPF